MDASSNMNVIWDSDLATPAPPTSPPPKRKFCFFQSQTYLLNGTQVLAFVAGRHPSTYSISIPKSPHHTAHTRPNQNPKSHSLIIGSTHLVIRSEALCCSCYMLKHFLPFCYHLLFAVSNHITASTPTHPSPSFTLTTKTKIYFRLNKLFNLNTCIKFSTFNSFS